MAIHDYNISNQSFPATRSDINSALGAILSSNSDQNPPSLPNFAPVAGTLWYDTNNNILKVYDGSAFEEIKSGDIVTGDLTANAVTTVKIIDDAVTAGKLNVSGNGTATQFLRSDADGSFSWATPPDNNTVTSAGSGLDLVGATLSVQPDLRDAMTHIGRDNNNYIIFNPVNFGFFLDGAERFRMESDGDMHCDGSVVAYSATVSDMNLKTAISTVDGALDKVSQLNGVEFTRKDSGKRSAGVIAQDVEKVLPQAVVERSLPLHTGTEEVFKTVEYDALHSLYIEAIKELKDMVEKQAVQIKELQGT
jgi:hypothetical protein